MMRKTSQPDSDLHSDPTPKQAHESSTVSNLQEALAVQEARIKELEAQLQDLQPEPGPSSSITPLRGRPRLISRGDTSAKNRATRMLIAMQDNENFKLPLTENVFTIGREPANDLQIRSRFVSRFHARIVTDDSGTRIEDIDSRNGVSVNTEPVSQRRLRSGDYIKIGRVQLQYIDITDMPGTRSHA